MPPRHASKLALSKLAQNLFVIALIAAATLPSWARAGADNGNDLRLQIGASSASSGPYCTVYRRGVCYDYYGYGYDYYTPFYNQWFVLGAEYDFAWQGSAHITIGARLLAAPYRAANFFMLEPDAAVTWKFGGFKLPIEPRLQLGLGLLLGPYGFGGGLRAGGGIGFLPKGKIGFGLDLILGLGFFGGYPLSQLQFTLGPEFHF